MRVLSGRPIEVSPRQEMKRQVLNALARLLSVVRHDAPTTQILLLRPPLELQVHVEEHLTVFDAQVCDIRNVALRHNNDVHRRYRFARDEGHRAGGLVDDRRWIIARNDSTELARILHSHTVRADGSEVAVKVAANPSR